MNQDVPVDLNLYPYPLPEALSLELPGAPARRGIQRARAAPLNRVSNSTGARRP